MLFQKSFKLDEIKTLATELVENLLKQDLKIATIVALKGDLGAGKTTLVQAIGDLLEVDEVITSPTFNIIKQYPTKHSVFQSLVHIDAYRIDSLNELGPLQFSTLISQVNTLVCIEWPERIEAAIPKGSMLVSLAVLDDSTRTVQVSRL
jgi:tRNA threonylcarbamoyladenosine biosynthesis protein TsaE